MTPMKKTMLLGLLIVLAACTPTKTTSSSPTTPVTSASASKPSGESMAKWASDNSAMSSVLGADMEAVSDAANSGSLSATVRACEAMGDDLYLIEDALPTPDPKLTRELQKAHDHFEKAARLCSSGTMGGLESATDEILEGSEAINRATDIIKSYT